MNVKIKKLCDEAVVPRYAKDGDAGMDLVAVSRVYDEYGNAVYGTGLAFEIPKGYVGLLFARSSISKVDLSLSNAVGVLDSGYRGEVMFKFKPTNAFYNIDESDSCVTDTFGVVLIPNGGSVSVEIKEDSGASHFEKMGGEEAVHFEIGDRIGQLIIMPYPQIDFIEVDELSETERGDGGYGSTGN